MFDVVIIGGGIAGVSAAAEMSAQARVLLLEAEMALGYHASGRSAAMYLENYGNDVVRALNRASLKTHQNAEVLSPKPMLMVAAAHEAQVFQAETRAFDATQLTPQAARDMLPILNLEHCAFAARVDDAFDIDTDRLIQHFARVTRANGGTIATGAEVKSLSRSELGWTVATGADSFQGKTIVNAAGPWADRIAALAGIAPLGIQPYRRSMARLPAPGGHDVRKWPFVLHIGEGWYAKPDAGAWLVSPCEEDPLDPQDAWADDMVIAEGLDRYARFVTEEVTRVETTWAGLRSFAPDKTLVLGPDVADPTFIWCAGQGGYGFQTAPAAARLLADLAAGRPSALSTDVVAALSPARFQG